MSGSGIGVAGRWRRAIVVSAILWLAPFVLMACALQDPLATQSSIDDSLLGRRPVSAVLAVQAPTEYAFFGSSVAVHGNTAVIGAWGESDHGRNTGAAYVFDRAGEGWIRRVRLTASDATAGARFGHAVAIDGTRILVSAIYHAQRGPRAGAVYAFELIDDAWRETERLLPQDSAPDAYFGSAVAMDGDTAVIGASGPGATAAYVFLASNVGWREQARLTPAAPLQGARFGSRVDVHGDVAVIAAPTPEPDFETVEDEAAPSSVFVFERMDDAWHQAALLTAGDDAADRQFAESVSVHGDRIAVGAPGAADAVYVFRRTESSWIVEREISGSAEQSEFFGISVALSEDALAVGAPGSADRSGAVYLFERVAGEWSPSVKVTASEPDEDLQLGGAVALDGSVAVIGATGGRSAGLASGAAFAVH